MANLHKISDKAKKEKRLKIENKVLRGAGDEKKKVYLLRLKLKNWVLLGGGIVFIGVGYLFLAHGSLTLAPILLVLGYCVLIPIGIILK